LQPLLLTCAKSIIILRRTHADKLLIAFDRSRKQPRPILQDQDHKCQAQAEDQDRKIPVSSDLETKTGVLRSISCTCLRERRGCWTRCNNLHICLFITLWSLRVPTCPCDPRLKHSGAMCGKAWRAHWSGFAPQPGASAYQRINSSNSYAHDEQGVNPEQEKRVRWCPL